MNFDAATLGLLLPAMIAGLLVTATHVPLGMQVIGRGIVFIDLAIAQIAGLGRDPRRYAWLGAAGRRDAGRGALGGACGGAAAHLDRTALAGSAGSDHRRDVRAGLERRDPAAGRQSARRRAPEGPADRPDPLGQSRAAAARCAGLWSHHRGVVRPGRAHRPRRFLCAVSRARSPFRCNWSGSILCSQRW